MNRAGKSTASKYYADYFFDAGFKIQQLSLATPIKKLAAKYLDLEDHRSDRNTLESFSADLKENLGEDVFIRTLLDNIDDDADFVLIDDLRYFVEIDMLRQIYDTKIIHVHRKIQSSKEDADRLMLLLFKFVTNDINVDWILDKGVDKKVGQQLCEHRFDKYPSMTQAYKRLGETSKKMGQFKLTAADKGYIYTVDCDQGIHTIQMLDGSNQVLVVTSDFMMPIEKLQARIENELLPTFRAHVKEKNKTHQAS